MSLPIPTEHEEQCAFIEEARLKLPYPEWKLLFAIPNGGLRNKVVAAKLKAEGVMPGVPDLFFSRPCGEYHGLYIEMKRPKGGRYSKDQEEMAELFIEQDADVVMFIYRHDFYEPDEPTNTAEIITKKLRNGAVGTDYLTWDGNHMCFSDMDYGHREPARKVYND